ncbi:MAG: sarcosine oxidase subunit gamma family protein [Acetobacteraceae bacterium]
MADRSHPLAASAAASVHCAAVQLAALPPTARFIVRDAGGLAAIGLAVPGVCRASVSGERAVLWLGPDEYLLLAPDDAAPRLVHAVDVSHRDAALTVSGARAAWVINAFCALDLHPSAFPVGMCTRTVFAKAEIVLWRTGPEIFRIDVARSVAPYVWACLEEARREFLA